MSLVSVATWRSISVVILVRMNACGSMNVKLVQKQ